MAKEKQHHKIEWFDKLRLNSWEVEILIVGFVLVVLFQVPATINFSKSAVLNSAALDSPTSILSVMGNFLSLASIGASVNILIFWLTVYLGLRGFWVGILGLSSVYPDGINLKKLNFSNRFTNDLKKYNFNLFIIKIDNICSSIFAFTFLLSFSVMSLLILAYEAVLILICGLMLSGEFGISPIGAFQEIIESAMVYALILFLIPGILYFIDYFLFGIFKKIKWKPFAFCYYYIDKFYKYATLVFIYDHLYYTFISNIKRRLIFGLFICYIIITSLLESRNERFFFPEKKSENLMQYYYYENQFPKIEKEDDASYPEEAFINSEIISANYLKLYIPYIPAINESLEDLCPDIMHINDEDIESDQENEVLHCINLAYNIFIDDVKIESDFIFYLYPHEFANIETFFMVVPLNEFINGRHILKVHKNVKAESDVDLGKAELQITRIESNTTTLIPFYIQRD